MILRKVHHLSLCFIFILFSSILNAQDQGIIELPLMPYLTYGTLLKKKQMIDSACHFSTDLEKDNIMMHMCYLDNKTFNKALESKRTHTKKIETFFSSCDLKNAKHTKSILNDYCHIQTPVTRKEILNHFCALDNHSIKMSHIQKLQNIIDMGAAYQKTINYNQQSELEQKHKEAFDLSIYNAKVKPHIEASYYLGVVYGFSDCGMRDFSKALLYFEQSLDKPETFFMVAELLRQRNNISDVKKIYEFYNYAVKLNIPKAAYNIALYIYEQLKKRKSNNFLLPQEFTYKNVIIFMQTAAKRNDVAALNDLPILMRRLYKNYQEKKIQDLTRVYLSQAAQQHFKPAIYNQIVDELSKPCNEKSLLIIEQNAKFLLAKNYRAVHFLLPLLNNNKCYQKIGEKMSKEIQKLSKFYEHHTLLISWKKQKSVKELAYRSFAHYDKEVENIMH